MCLVVGSVIVSADGRCKVGLLRADCRPVVDNHPTNRRPMSWCPGRLDHQSSGGELWGCYQLTFDHYRPINRSFLGPKYRPRLMSFSWEAYVEFALISYWSRMKATWKFPYSKFLLDWRCSFVFNALFTCLFFLTIISIAIWNILSSNS